jgi:hypothetical protein
MAAASTAFLAAVHALAAFWSPAQAQQRALDRDLIAAGFVMRPADTPGKMKRLQALAPHRFTARTKDGVRYYIYPDAADCKCAFVGYQQAYDNYRAKLVPPTPPPGIGEFKSDATAPRGLNLEHLAVGEMDDDAGLIPGDDIFHLKF